ncbi:lipase family protein [Oscillatoria sp. CS-180]|uniref:lipase family protein n=1 Tax=Oscillatoria sp. CS-180 TaxID=3021720 RepID=UPI00232BC53D|nr:lipase family protein [Oscillatoria sp. CS-180]MDB9525127.1 lipase family protein [Oscillatoria sp. CS-180]
MTSQNYPRYFENAENIALPAGSERYEPHTAWWLAQCSRLAYDSKLNIANNLQQVGFDRVFYFDMRGTQGFLAIHPGDGHEFAVLAFRGTEKNYIDILTDIFILRTKLPDVEGKEYGEGPLFAHAGFLRAFQAVWGTALPNAIRDQMNEAEWIGARGVSDIIQEKIEDPRTPLFVTGHSLGGAIATLSAYHALPYHPSVYLYTFGSPRVVNALLGKKIDAVLDTRSYRCVYGDDIVPRVPPLFNYTHINQVVYFDPVQGRMSNKSTMRNDLLVILMLHLDALLFFLTLKARKPKTTLAHAIAAYIRAVEREPLKPRVPSR